MYTGAVAPKRLDTVINPSIETLLYCDTTSLPEKVNVIYNDDSEKNSLPVNYRTVWH